MSELHVVFGTGPLGKYTARELVKLGKTVRMVNRSGKADQLPGGVEIVASDAYDAAKNVEVTKGATAIYQCAQPPYNRWPQEFPPLQASIMEGLAGSGAKLVIAENMYMYGDAAGKPLSESLPHAAQTRKGRTRAAMSESALAAHREGRVRVAIGRGSDYFGPWGDNSTMGGRVFPPLFRGKPAQPIGRIDLPHTHTYLKDFGRALFLLGERDEADGQAWHVPNDMPEISQGELVRIFCEESGLEPKISAMGRTMLRLGGLFVPEARESLEMMYAFEKPLIVDSTRFERAFGMRPTPMREALRETAAWYREQARSARTDRLGEQDKRTFDVVASGAHPAPPTSARGVGAATPSPLEPASPRLPSPPPSRQNQPGHLPPRGTKPAAGRRPTSRKPWPTSDRGQTPRRRAGRARRSPGEWLAHGPC
jgi:nucleoside-diphosphate-sugar epimerase